MSSDEILSQRLDRLHALSLRASRIFDHEEKKIEQMFLKAVSDFEQKKKEVTESYTSQELELKGRIEQLGKEYSTTKYKLERDSTTTKADIERAKAEYDLVVREKTTELNRLNEDKVKSQISIDRQKQALTELYEEKKRSLSVTRGKLLQNWQAAEARLKDFRNQSADEISKINEDWSRRINTLKSQAESKSAGWSNALEAMRRENDTLKTEKAHLEKRLAEISGEKEKELQAAQLALRISQEQLEVDKATLIENAEEDQRRTEAEVQDLKRKIESAEQDLATLTVSHENAKKDSEEAYLKEETMLKEAVKAESEKRDFEQKLFEQEKKQKETELNHLKEEYEKKKWQWDNQIRALMLQKSVQDSEHEAERLRVDREARTAVRGLEAKRDELKTRLADLKNRHSSLSVNSKKEMDLLNQRWQWRRDRLWALWQNRLDVLRKERETLHDQIESLEAGAAKEKARLTESETRDVKRVESLEGFMSQSTEQHQGSRKQRQIQMELEKTRLFAQIKECEVLISDWMDRLKSAQEEPLKEKRALMEQMGVLDRWYQEEEKEGQLFLETLQYALKTFEKVLADKDIRNAA